MQIFKLSLIDGERLQSRRSDILISLCAGFRADCKDSWLNETNIAYNGTVHINQHIPCKSTKLWSIMLVRNMNCTPIPTLHNTIIHFGRHFQGPFLLFSLWRSGIVFSSEIALSFKSNLVFLFCLCRSFQKMFKTLKLVNNSVRLYSLGSNRNPATALLLQK